MKRPLLLVALAVIGLGAYLAGDELRAFFGWFMPSATWGIVGSLLLAVPPGHDLWIRACRTTAEEQATGDLSWLATAVARGWERQRNSLSIFDILCVGLGALSLAVSFFLA